MRRSASLAVSIWVYPGLVPSIDRLPEAVDDLSFVVLHEMERRRREVSEPRTAMLETNLGQMDQSVHPLRNNTRRSSPCGARREDAL